MKKRLCVIAVMTFMGVLTACKVQPYEEETTQITTEAVTQEETTQETTEETTQETPSKVYAPEYNISKIWSDLQFAFDGDIYTLPIAYSKLSANGWKVHLEDYGYTDGLVIEAGARLSAAVSLYNEAYNEKFTINVGFVNNSDRDMDITECQIWEFGCDISYGYTKLDNVPLMVIANGVTWGSDIEEIREVYGEPSYILDSKELYGESENNYVVYTYMSDYNYYMQLTVFEKYGLTGIKLQEYN